MVPSAIVYTNPFTVFPADDEANAGFLDMTKPSISDPTKVSPVPSIPTVLKMPNSNGEKLKMTFDREPVGAFKKHSSREKQ
jgi:hypothetical protein